MSTDPGDRIERQHREHMDAQAATDPVLAHVRAQHAAQQQQQLDSAAERLAELRHTQANHRAIQNAGLPTRDREREKGQER